MTNSKSRIFRKPGTKLGWWAIGLAIAFILMMIFNSIEIGRLPDDTFWRPIFWPIFSIGMFVCGVAALVIGLIAIIGKKERSWAVWLALIPGAFAFLFILGELIFPH